MIDNTMLIMMAVLVSMFVVMAYSFLFINRYFKKKTLNQINS